MIIDCIADLHGYYPRLEGGDLLIVAGDLTASDKPYQHIEFGLWMATQDYRRKILIAGNHDNLLQASPVIFEGLPNNVITYLCDSGTEFEGLKIWGSPWTKSFVGMNPKCKAFTVDTEEELAVKFSLIPDDMDILITHSPPYGLGRLDELHNGDNVGSYELRKRLMQLKLKIHVFGHIHEQGGGEILFKGMKLINASHVNEHYEPVNKPIRVIL